MAGVSFKTPLHQPEVTVSCLPAPGGPVVSKIESHRSQLGLTSNGAPRVDSETGRGFGKGDRPRAPYPAREQTGTSGLPRLAQGTPIPDTGGEF
jgi:hypothetical protein